jgi:hypothetical protein
VTRVIFISVQAQPHQRFYSNEVCAKHTEANCWSNPKHLRKKGNVGSSTGDRASSSGLCDDSQVNILNHKKICV